ncbi:MAG: hypothetical protein ACR2KT_16495 [Methylocella sp.]
MEWPNARGKAAFGDTRAIEASTKPASDPESYGSIWAQEIAHNFGRMHVSTSHHEMPPTDPAFPYAHGGIAAADNSKHAHDFMSYGANDSQDHTHSWVSPFTYNGLWSSFAASSNVAIQSAQAAVDKLVIGGNFDKNGKVSLYPFHILHTALTSGQGHQWLF